ncbi:MAG: hypothetical protein ACLGJC_27570 [Alphaproteobacteria bacterium]
MWCLQLSRLLIVLPLSAGWTATPAGLPVRIVMAKVPSASVRFPDIATAELAKSAARGDAAAGADPNAGGTEGMMPLLYAIAGNSKAGAKALLEVGADPNRRARDGESRATR